MKGGLYSSIFCLLFFAAALFASNFENAVFSDSEFKAARQAILDKNYTEAVKLLQGVNERYPEQPTVLDHLAYSYLKLNMNEDAIFTYKNAIREAKKNSDSSSKDIAKMYANLGLAYAQDGKSDEAIRAYKKAVDIMPDYAKAWQSLGQMYAKLGEEDQVVEAYQRSVLLEPNVFQSWIYLGAVYVKKGQITQALEAYQKATQLNPNSSEAWQGLGGVYLKLKRTQEANDAFAKASQIAPKSFSVYDKKVEAKESPQVIPYLRALELKPQDVESWRNLTQAYVREGQFDKAIAINAYALRTWGGDLEDEDNEKLVKNKQEIFTLLNDLGQTYYTAGKFKESIDTWKRAIQILTNNGKDKNVPDYGAQDRLWYKIGLAYQRQNKIPQAINAYKKVTDLNPNYANAWKRLSEVYKLKGDKSASKKALKKYKTLMKDAATE